MKICFVSDIFLGGDLRDSDKSAIVDLPEYHSADLRIGNLEQAISSSNDVVDKCTLYTEPGSLSRLTGMGIEAVNLANNHIQDKGQEGIGETADWLEKNAVSSFGAGRKYSEARAPFLIDESTVIFGYCDFEKSYLKQVEIAGSDSPGVNPLRPEAISSDLDSLDEGQQAILYFHWGKEHVWLPKYNDLELAKRFLKDDRVALILGMHAHRAQGCVSYGEKKAYMCMGNFLFPNFYISPPTQLSYATEGQQKSMVTRQYHNVHEVTYKKWRYVNRVSIAVSYDTKSRGVSHRFAIQDDCVPQVSGLTGVRARLALVAFEALSGIYRLPRLIYVPLEWVTSKVFGHIWRLQVYVFHLRQMGGREFLALYAGKLFRKLKRSN